jgi:hypothetical protein
MSADQPLHMWPYWRNKEGFVQALIQCYPNRLKASFVLQQAVYAALAAEATVEGHMNNAILKEDDDVS